LRKKKNQVEDFTKPPERKKKKKGEGTAGKEIMPDHSIQEEKSPQRRAFLTVGGGKVELERGKITVRDQYQGKNKGEKRN